MGIKEGSRLLWAGIPRKIYAVKGVETGVYPHVAGDGREYVITDDTAVKFAEDGRSKTDISMFINDLPNGKGHGFICTEDASEVRLKAAVISMEAGTSLFDR